MAQDEIKHEEFEEDQERILTLRINLEGPAEFVSWLRESRPRGLGVGDRLSSLLPSDFRQHMRAAQKEQLLAMRSLLDAAINRMEEKPKHTRRAVDVEID